MSATPPPRPFDPHARDALLEIFARTPQALRERVAEVARAHAADLADHFYERMLADEYAHRYLNHEIVSQRLRASMQRWLVQLLATSDAANAETLVARQIDVGAVHARIKLPPNLMQLGTRILNARLRTLLAATGLGAEELPVAVLYVSDLFNLADGLMMSAYVRDLQKSARADEAYRHVAMRQDIALERERQRAVLFEWANNLLFGLRPGVATRPTSLAGSEFGLWFKHKARVLFDELPDAQIITDTVELIDQSIVPKLLAAIGDPERTNEAAGELQRKLEFIRYLLSDLFDRLSSIDQGRDSITGLYSWRHLGAVLSRERDEHQRSGKPFGTLLLRVECREPPMPNEETLRVLLQQVAAVVIETARAGDHVFRYGASEFMILAVETSAEGLDDLARVLRNRIRGRQFHSREHAAIRVAAGIGVARFDGHPDYARLLRKAENAVAQALARGGEEHVAL